MATASSTGVNARTTLTDAHGEFSFFGCSDGLNALSLTWPGNPETPFLWCYAIGLRADGPPVRLTASQDAAPSAWVRGTVEPANTVLALVALNEGCGKAVLVDVDRATGEFEIGPIPPGSYVLQLFGAQVPTARSVVVGVRDEVDLGTITTDAPIPVRVKVRMPDGSPPDRFRIRAGWAGKFIDGDSGDPHSPIQFGNSGDAVVNGLLPGFNKLFVSVPGMATGYRLIRLGDEEEREVEIDLQPGQKCEFQIVGHKLSHGAVRLVIRSADPKVGIEYDYQRKWDLAGDAPLATFRCSLPVGKHELEFTGTSGEDAKHVIEIVDIVAGRMLARIEPK